MAMSPDEIESVRFDVASNARAVYAYSMCAVRSAIVRCVQRVHLSGAIYGVPFMLLRNLGSVRASSSS